MSTEPPDPPSLPDVAGLPASDDLASEALRIDDLYLVTIGADRRVTVQLDRITLAFDREGVRVERAGEGIPRVLPWAALTTHVVEPWHGGITPEWWVDPELNRSGSAATSGAVLDTNATNRPLPGSGNGALISLQTPFATYRFLAPAHDAESLADDVAALALNHQGPSGAPSVTTVVERPVPRSVRRAAVTSERRGVTWRQVQPVLVVALIVFFSGAVTLILLQSAGTIHLPFLGGASPGMVQAISLG